MTLGQTVTIRTGCLRCRSLGLRCNPTDPQCRTHGSANWSTNRTVAQTNSRSRQTASYSRSGPSTLGLSFSYDCTHRERHSLRFFATITAPELAGWFDGDFYCFRLLQVTVHDAAIKHIVAAIGATHECSLRKQVSRDNGETSSLASFALRQCNRAIEGLIRPPTDLSNGGSDVLPTLTASVLFACYENMNDRRAAAVPHILYARRLAEQYKLGRLQTLTRTVSYPVEVGVIEPLVAHYESQLGADFLNLVTDDQVCDLDLSAPLRFASVNTARSSLEKAIAELASLIMARSACRTCSEIERMPTQKAQYAQWLSRWDVAFTTYLADSQAGFDVETTNACRILKAHQLAAYTLACLDSSLGERAWQAHVHEFRAILKLITEVLNTMPRKVIAASVPQTAHFSIGMGITEPLYCVAARCTDPEIAMKAKTMLHRLPQNEGAHSAWRTSFIEASLCAATGKSYEQPPSFEVHSSSTATSTPA